MARAKNLLVLDLINHYPHKMYRCVCEQCLGCQFIPSVVGGGREATALYDFLKLTGLQGLVPSCMDPSAYY